jgi:hypothetical protein
MSFNLYNLGAAPAQTSVAVQAGPFRGFSATQTTKAFRDGEGAMTRRVLRSAWNNVNVASSINGYGRIITPFRAVNSAGDYLSRQNYRCGGAVENNGMWRPGNSRSMGAMLSACDQTGVAAQSGNGRFVPDSSEYIRYRKHNAINRTYNDLTFGADDSHGSASAVFHIRH